jgi:hypothetical protein
MHIQFTISPYVCKFLCKGHNSYLYSKKIYWEFKDSIYTVFLVRGTVRRKFFKNVVKMTAVIYAIEGKFWLTDGKGRLAYIEEKK